MLFLVNGFLNFLYLVLHTVAITLEIVQVVLQAHQWLLGNDRYCVGLFLLVLLLLCISKICWWRLLRHNQQFATLWNIFQIGHMSSVKSV
jgi:hypothetical protein